jgi:hypothetical protein
MMNCGHNNINKNNLNSILFIFEVWDQQKQQGFLLFICLKINHLYLHLYKALYLLVFAIIMHVHPFIIQHQSLQNPKFKAFTFGTNYSLISRIDPKFVKDCIVVLQAMSRYKDNLIIRFLYQVYFKVCICEGIIR